MFLCMTVFVLWQSLKWTSCNFIKYENQKYIAFIKINDDKKFVQV